MPRTRIKICGICRPQDAAIAASAGADAIGIVFHPAAKRFITIDAARDITAAVPPFVTLVGLFVDAPLATIRQAMDQLPLAAIQLHGNESPELIHQLKPTPVIKAIRVRTSVDLDPWKRAIPRLKLTNLIGLLLETPAEANHPPGGTGIANDWSTLTALKNTGAFNDLPPIIAAGGLTPQTVADVVHRLRPWAVDVSSGVESAHREKSPEKIQAFIRAVRQADELPQ